MEPELEIAYLRDRLREHGTVVRMMHAHNRKNLLAAENGVMLKRIFEDLESENRRLREENRLLKGGTESP